MILYKCAWPLCVLLCAQYIAYAASAAAGKTSPANLARSDIKRLATSQSARPQELPKAASKGATKSVSTKQVDQPQNKRFQPRMMSNMDAPMYNQMEHMDSSSLSFRNNQPQQQSQYQQQPQPQPQFASGSSSDSWAIHSLVPTFTDQEQGDEMVALASDTHDAEPVRVAAPPSGAAASPPASAVAPGERLNQKEAQATNKARRPLKVSDYYAEDADEADDETEVATGGASAAAAHKFAPTHSEESTRPQPPAPRVFNYTDAPPRVTASTESSWQPTERKVTPMEQQHQQSQIDTKRHRFMGLLSGASVDGSLTRADAAIEYLRNILKSKQKQTNASTPETGDDVPIVSTPKPVGLTKPQEQQRENESSILSDEAHARLQQSFKDFKLPYSHSSPVEPMIEAPRALRVAQQTDSKFSILDAKPAAPKLPEYAPSSTTTTKLPTSTYLREQFQHDQSVIPNGTPLGGDYIESLDDSPRANRGRLAPHYMQAQASSHSNVRAYAPAPAQETQVPLPHSANAPAFPLPVGPASYLQGPAGVMQSTQQIDMSGFSHSLTIQHEQPKSTRYFQVFQPHHNDTKSELSAAIESFKNQTFHNYEPTTAAATKLASPTVAQEIIVSTAAPIAPSTSPESVQTNTTFAQSELPVSFMSDAAPWPQWVLDYDKQRKQLEDARDQLQQQQQDHHQHQHQYIHNPQVKQQPIPRPPAQLDNNQHKEVPVSMLESFLSRPEPQQVQDAHYAQTQAPASQSDAFVQPIQQQEPTPIMMPHTQTLQQPAYQPPAPALKPPKIVSYNYFESPSDSGESELMATNYQLGDALYSSTGGVEQTLSPAELEAIQSQFMTAEHQVVPLKSPSDTANTAAQQHQHLNQHQQQQQQQQQRQQQQAHEQDASLSGLFAGLKPSAQIDMLQKDHQNQHRHTEDLLKELASNEDAAKTFVPPPISAGDLHTLPFAHPTIGVARQPEQKQTNKYTPASDEKKKKSLIVYLNHPRPVDMSKMSNVKDGFTLSQSIGDQSQLDMLISAKEFDNHGFSQQGVKNLDVSKLPAQDGSPDKDGLSVVVIGDAYKYKKIVLLISSKSGGLKFVPMVKDMKK